MQKRIAIDGFDTVQPTKFELGFATTMTEDSGRAMGGAAKLTPLFTVEAYEVEYKNLTPAEATRILRAIIPTPSKPTFPLYYYSSYAGAWQTKPFYVGDGTLVLKTLKENEEGIDYIACTFVGKDKIC